MLQIKCFVIAIAIVTGVSHMSEMDSQPKRDINAVLHDHEKELLAIPNVVGVYVGVLELANKPCLKVMLSRELSKSDRSIPKSIEGYPVITEVTGEIRPLRER